MQYNHNCYQVGNYRCPPVSITSLSPEPQRPRLLAIAYGANQALSIVTYFLTETGFDQGPELVNLPYRITDLAGGNLLPDPGEELVTAGNDGFVRIYTANNQLRLGLLSKNLETRV